MLPISWLFFSSVSPLSESGHRSSSSSSPISVEDSWKAPPFPRYPRLLYLLPFISWFFWVFFDLHWAVSLPFLWVVVQIAFWVMAVWSCLCVVSGLARVSVVWAAFVMFVIFSIFWCCCVFCGYAVRLLFLLFYRWKDSEFEILLL